MFSEIKTLQCRLQRRMQCSAADSGQTHTHTPKPPAQCPLDFILRGRLKDGEPIGLELLKNYAERVIELRRHLQVVHLSRLSAALALACGSNALHCMLLTDLRDVPNKPCCVAGVIITDLLR